MALIPKLTKGVPEYKGNGQYEIPVLLELVDGEDVVYTKTIQVQHNESRTITESLGQDEVKNELQDAMDAYCRHESVKAQAEESTNAIEVLQGKLGVKKAMINKMIEVEEAIGNMPGAKFGDDACPLKHHFGDGLYIREMTAPKGMINVSKLHKTTHPYFILKGEASVLTEKGMVRIKAPHFGITKAGTKRVVYFHEDTVWITVHATEETDLKKIEDEIIAKNYDELPERNHICRG